MLTVVVVGGCLVLDRQDAGEVLVRERCTATVGTDSYDLTPEQADNAALIAGIAVARSLPPRAASIAIATAMQESSLRNLDHGDDAGPDSRGLFQQRPSQGWGTQEQVMTPNYAAGAFYDALVEVPGYEALPLTVAAQTVQRSAFPNAYATRESQGRAYASALTGQSPAALTCVLRAPADAGSAARVAADADGVFGPLGGVVEGGTLTLEATGTTGWALAQWAVASAARLGITEVAHAGRTWTRADGGWTGDPSDDTTVRVTVSPGTP